MNNQPFIKGRWVNEFAEMDHAKLREYLDPIRFSAWLNDHLLDASVGHAGFGSSCPLATYLADQPNVVLATVGTRSVVCHFKHHRTIWDDSPEWVAKFVIDIDRRAGGSQVTAQEAKETLERALR